jgi:hypothetical protein
MAANTSLAGMLATPALKQGRKPFHGKGPYPLLRTGSWAARGK